MADGDWFTDYPDMKSRFPDLEDGIEVHERIMQSPLVLKTNFTISWFDTDNRQQAPTGYGMGWFWGLGLGVRNKHQ